MGGSYVEGQSLQVWSLVLSHGDRHRNRETEAGGRRRVWSMSVR